MTLYETFSWLDLHTIYLLEDFCVVFLIFFFVFNSFLLEENDKLINVDHFILISCNQRESLSFVTHCIRKNHCKLSTKHLAIWNTNETRSTKQWRRVQNSSYTVYLVKLSSTTSSTQLFLIILSLGRPNTHYKLRSTTYDVAQSFWK